jgi:hypothetical protein
MTTPKKAQFSRYKSHRHISLNKFHQKTTSILAAKHVIQINKAANQINS